MTVTGIDSVVIGKITRKSNPPQSEGSKVYRGMLKFFY